VELSSFVGRQAELRSLIERLQAAEQGHGGLVLVAGERALARHAV
jgi:hypothetical protein